MLAERRIREGDAAHARGPSAARSSGEHHGAGCKQRCSGIVKFIVVSSINRCDHFSFILFIINYFIIINFIIIVIIVIIIDYFYFIPIFFFFFFIIIFFIIIFFIIIINIVFFQLYNDRFKPSPI